MAAGRRILLVINALDADGGAEAQLTHLARGLSERDYEVTLCCIDRCRVDRSVFEERGVRLVELGVESRAQRLLAIPRLARLARKSDIVQCTMWDSSLWGRLAAILARRPVIVADHATDRSVQVSANGDSRADWIERHNRLLDRFTFATVACALSQRPVLESEGVDPEKIVYIPNGVPMSEMAATAAAAPSRAELGLPDDGPLLMQVGVFRPEKNQSGALAAFERLADRFENAQLVFVGRGSELQAVEAEAASTPATDRIHFLGLRSDVPYLLAHAAVMLLPSLADAMPMVVLEALAIGIPTVASAVGDIPSLLAGGGGVTVPPGDTEAFAAACGALLTDSSARERMAKAARSASATYDSERMIDRYAALLDTGTAGLAARDLVAGPTPRAVI